MPSTVKEGDWESTVHENHRNDWHVVVGLHQLSIFIKVIQELVIFFGEHHSGHGI